MIAFLRKIVLRSHGERASGLRIKDFDHKKPEVYPEVLFSSSYLMVSQEVYPGKKPIKDTSGNVYLEKNDYYGLLRVGEYKQVDRGRSNTAITKIYVNRILDGFEKLKKDCESDPSKYSKVKYFAGISHLFNHKMAEKLGFTLLSFSFIERLYSAKGARDIKYREGYKSSRIQPLKAETFGLISKQDLLKTDFESFKLQIPKSFKN